ncbi:uncharacterized protein LOC143296574 [Babylonia areolata]|uniref:uncharacterized protein LOC143296574 n=1 Tax=Babylonia areolata TaxID=304850 RepID=UPI003FCF0829
MHTKQHQGIIRSALLVTWEVAECGLKRPAGKNQLTIMCSVLLVLVVVSGALGQIPTPCGGPPSFTGNFRRFDRERQEFVEGKMFYDAVNQRIREFEFEKIGSTSAVYDKLKLYQTNTEYTVDLKTRKCNVTEPRPRTWFPFGVPPDARFSGEGTLGAVGVPNEQLTIAIFTGEFEGRGNA